MTPAQHAPPILRWLSVCLMAATLINLSGCAQPRWAASPPPENDNPPQSCETLGSSPADNTRLAAVEEILNEGKFYAAIAQVDALNNDSPKARLIRAEALRRIDRTKEAQGIYQDLLSTCMAGRAHHGLGLLAAYDNKHAESLQHLRQARQALPTDPRVRNDLGYALLLAGQIDDARFEFLTALDLNPRDVRAARNLVLMTFRQGAASQARQLADRLGVDPDTTDKLATQAASMQAQTGVRLQPSPSSPDTRPGSSP